MWLGRVTSCRDVSPRAFGITQANGKCGCSASKIDLVLPKIAGESRWLQGKVSRKVLISQLISLGHVLFSEINHQARITVEIQADTGIF